jgi:DNA-binding MarR family transcriptional regulator
MTRIGQPSANLSAWRESAQELSLESCLRGAGVTLLSQWDVLAFLYRHGASLTTPDQIAHLTGYDTAVVSDVLDYLNRENLIQRSRPSAGVCLYRITSSMDTGRRHCFQQLVNLSESRAGRLLLAERLNPIRGHQGREPSAQLGK